MSAQETETDETTEPGEGEAEEEEAEEGADEVAEAEDEQRATDSLPVGPTEAEIERMMGQGEREATRHANRVSEIFGDEAQSYQPCPLCLPFAPGFMYDPAIMPVPDPVRQAVRVAWGEPPEPEYQKDNYSRACDACDGLGSTFSGSKVPGQRALVCYACKGKGWVAVGNERQYGYTAPVEDANGAQLDVAAEPLPDLDPFGRGPSDPNYGRMPQYVRD